jgi:hypothetical protein
MSASDRRETAIAAAVEVARSLGVRVESPMILKDSNNTIIDLGVDDLVAKVATSTLAGSGRGFDVEFSVLRHLHHRSTTTSRLSDRVPHGPHQAGASRLFFMDRLEITDDTFDRRAAGDVLLATHVALASYEGELPDFVDTIALGAECLSDPERSPTLPVAERSFCTRAWVDLRSRLANDTWAPTVLHGDPWVGGNLVMTTAGPRLLDFEAVCRGPLEWDLSALGELPDGAISVDVELLRTCRLLRSLLVAGVCWAQPSRAPEVDEAAQVHLRILHDALDDT